MEIQYSYPIDRYDYLISYAGNKIPLKDAFLEMQDEFEDTCRAQSLENIQIRQSNEKRQSVKPE